MRKPLHAQCYSPKQQRITRNSWYSMLTLLALFLLPNTGLQAQCVTQPGEIRGRVFQDLNYNAIVDAGERMGHPAIDLVLLDKNGVEVQRKALDELGTYSFTGLNDGELYQLYMDVPDYLSIAQHGTGFDTDIRSVESPSCQVDFGWNNPAAFCDSENPNIAVTCFVKGAEGVNDDMETVVFTPYAFNPQSQIQKVASKGQTGSVFGTAWRSGDQSLFLSAFVKQDAYLKSKLGSIFRAAEVGGMFQASEWTSLEDLGINVGQLSVVQAEDCEYGEQVGKVGLGGMEISPDEKYLLVVNLYNKSLVIIDIDNPLPSTTMEVAIPKTDCYQGEFRPFGIKFHEGKYYVTSTCDASSSQNKRDHEISVLEFDLDTKSFVEVFSTRYTRDHWLDAPANNNVTQHWLTDIEFADNGNMILGIADRISHRYCHTRVGLINQFPDILMVWDNNDNDSHTWTLESNGIVGGISGSGVGNGQGPGGGEFFGEEYWILGPLYHPELATGSLFHLPGSDEVVATVFDPLYNTFTGGFHRYGVEDGRKKGAIQLYSASNPATFGKGSGLGNIIDMCGPAPIQIGNLVWLDSNQNGKQDVGENGIAGLELSLFDDQCNLLQTITTDAEGRYYFSGGLEYHSSYYIAITDPAYDASKRAVIIGGEEHQMTLSKVGSPILNSDAEVLTTPCSALENLIVVQANTRGPGFVDHSFDLGLINEPVIVAPNDTFDLALIKRALVNTPVKHSQLVEYEITIFNQGNVAAKNIEIVDYMPVGLSFPALLNPGWGMVDGNPSYTITETIMPGEQRSVTFTMQVGTGQPMSEYINFAEIVSAEDEMGQRRDDIDSTPDRDMLNDRGGEPDSANDNMYTDDGTIDEDDHDPATIQIMDLALIKTTNFASTVRPGDLVPFIISVRNQGNVSVGSFSVAEHLPSGMQLAPASPGSWQVNGQMLTTTVNQVLAPGNQVDIEVLVEITPGAAQGNLRNVAEIYEVRSVGGDLWSAYDFDSTPDQDPSNDNGGVVASATDNAWDGDGTMDEDDQDPEQLYVFDLAMIKTVGQAIVSDVGQPITYTFTVFNQGEIAAKDVVLLDHLPDGFVFNPNENPGWTMLNPNLVEYRGSEVIQPGSQVQVNLILSVIDDVFSSELINVGEISEAYDVNDVACRDFDSVPDGDPTNDVGGEIGQATDDQYLDGGAIDEDDQDPAIVRASRDDRIHDVSLVKRGTPHHDIDDTVEFELIVYNEGEYVFSQVDLVDYLPFFLNNIDPNWEVGVTGLTRTLEAGDELPVGGLNPGDSVLVTLRTTINPFAFPGYIMNAAEVANVISVDGMNLSLMDVDSQADMDPRNDVSDNIKEQQGGAGPGSVPVEDDRGAFEILISKIELRDTCICENTDDFDMTGTFSETVVVTSGSGEHWYVDTVFDFYRNISAGPTYDEFATGPAGYQLTETEIGNDLSEYSITGYFEEATSYYLVVKNVEVEAAHSINSGQSCRYNRLGIEGPVNVCVGSEQTYDLINPTPGGVYQWTVDPAGGTIVGADNRSTVRVQWNMAAGGPYELAVNEASPDDCMAPSRIMVTIGDEFAFSLSCIGDANIGLDDDCEIMVTPQMLLTGGPYDYSSYNVMLTDEHGHPINGAVLDASHIGQRIMAKVINSCTGNSCWSWLTVEDKLPPQIECFNDTIRCISLNQFAYPRAVDACDPSPTIHLLQEVVYPLDCDTNYIKRVTRYFQAEDMYGNLSDTCTQVIMLERIVLDSIVFPDSFTIAGENPLICESFATDSFGFPLPDSFGIPTYQGIPIWPQEYYCNVGVDYKDTELGQVGCVRKVLREWRVFEWWCTQEFEVISWPQYFEITDTVPPVFVNGCPDVEYVHTNVNRCNADVLIERPEVRDSCGQLVKVDLVYPGGFIEDFTTREVTLPIDTNILTFRAYDECYNVDSCQFTVIVEDNTPPVAICDQFTTVGLTDTGIAYIYAQTFDDGSYDNCDLKSMEVKRMDDGANCGLAGDQFGPFVEFCCEDVGENVMVIFRVTDKLGNQNSCMVEVEVQDKIPPRIYCPPADTITCETHYDTSDLSQFGEPIIHDNCDFTLTYQVFEHVDQCREGYLERVWVAADNNNRVSCSQRIYIINEEPFDSTDITWPLNFDTTECREDFLTPDLLPEEHAFPIVDEDFCDLVGMTYSDQSFSFTQNNVACFKIVRTWKIINWCRFDSTTTGDIWTHEQVIKVNNDVAPTITSSCDTIKQCVFDDCDFGFVPLSASANDDCTDSTELRWEYHIDYDRDGIVDASNAGIGFEVDASRDVPLGEHEVRWVFEDKCGNRTVCTQPFEVFNCKPPTAYCKNGLVVDLVAMDLDGDGECDTEMVEIWAEDLDDNSESLCDYPLCYSFGRDTTNKNLVLDCDDLGRVELEICVTDPRGYVSCCNTFVIVQDNNDLDCCPDVIDKDCVRGPLDVNLSNCDASTDPDDLMSRPNTSGCNVDSIRMDYTDEDGTTGDVCLKIKRTWEVTLFLNGGDTTCTYVHCITIDNEFTEDSIIWPMDSIVLLGCNNSLDTSNTGGVPRLIGDYCDYVTVEYADEQLERPDTVCTYFQRTWTVTNGCDNDKEYTFTQLIIFMNQAPPTLTVPSDITVDSEVGRCGANVTLPAVTWTDCSSGVTVENDFNADGEDASGFYEVGKTTVTFTATDSCGNVAMGQTCVTVLDVEPPMLSCPMDLTFDCDVDVDGIVFGGPTASDNCSAFTLEIDTTYDLNICNIGTITRQIIARDTSGNADTCVQTVTIENMDPFDEDRITWPDSIVMVTECGSTDPDTTGRPEFDTAGVACVRLSVEFMDTMYMDSCMGEPCNVIERKWTVIDSCQLDSLGAGTFCFTQRIELTGALLMITCPPDTTIFCEDGIGDLMLYGDVMVETDCGLDTIIRDSTGMLNQCDIGTITRTFTVRDTLGHELTCEQVITIEIRDPFVEARITWPMDTVRLESCDSLDLSKTGEPMLDTAGLSCFDLSVTFTDTMYAGTCDGEPCEIIERTWMVTDSCQLDGMGGGIWTFLQIIEIDGGMISVTCPPDTTVSCESDLSDLSVFGDLTVESPCGIDTIIRDSIIDLNDCNVGTITRSIIARDTVGNEVSCSQVITVESPNPFNVMNITWPQDTLQLDGCASLDPDSLMSRPQLDTAASTCFDLEVTFSDSSSSSCMQDPCLIVVRTWTVVDSCQLDSLGNGIFTFEQRLEVNDTTPPMFTVPEIDTLIIADSVSCNSMIASLTASATDCSSNITITNNSPFAISGGDDAAGTYPSGVTEFFFFAEDECCNRDSIMATVEVVDTFPPQVTCTKVIKRLTDTITGVSFFPEDDVRLLVDNCTDSADIRLSFSLTDPNDTIRTYNCDSVRARGIPNPIFVVTVYAFDEAGNVDSCEVLHQVLDLAGCIPISSLTSVSGLVKKVDVTPIQDVRVSMQNSGLSDKMTSDLGVYQFEPMPMGGQYVIIPEKNDDPLNGVTTKDLILIQRHLLGIDEFDNPYDFIAADVNGNEDVAVSDMLVLRRMLLGYYSSFPSNTSWRFIEDNYVFPDPLDPWFEEFPEQYDIDSLQPFTLVDFKGVKIGDLSGDASNLDANIVRSGDALELQVQREGDWIYVVKPAGQSYEGVQFTMHFEEGSEPIELRFDPDGLASEMNFGFHSLDEGMITAVIDEHIPAEEVVLFGLPRNAVHGKLRLSSTITPKVAYDVDLNERDVVIVDEDASTDYVLYQNRPNPFNEGTIIAFELPESQSVRLSIMNVSGQLVYQTEGVFNAGYQEIEIKSKDLKESGVYYYRMDCGGYSKTMKMINLN